MNSFSLIFDDQLSFFSHCKNISPNIFPIKGLIKCILKNESEQNKKTEFLSYEHELHEIVLAHKEFPLNSLKEFHAIIIIFANFLSLSMSHQTLIDNFLFLINHLKTNGYLDEMEDCLFSLSKLMETGIENEMIMTDKYFYCQTIFLSLQNKIQKSKGEKLKKELAVKLNKNNKDFLQKLTNALDRIEIEDEKKLFIYLNKIFNFFAKWTFVDSVENLSCFYEILNAFSKYLECFSNNEKEIIREDSFSSLFWYGELEPMSQEKGEKIKVIFQKLLNVINIKIFKLHFS